LNTNLKPYTLAFLCHKNRIEPPLAKYHCVILPPKMGLHVASGLSSKRSSIASIASLTPSRKSSLSTTPDDSPEGRIASVVAHFSDPDLVIASTEADATLDKGYLRGWAGGYGGGNGRKSPLTEGERFWLVSDVTHVEVLRLTHDLVFHLDETVYRSVCLNRYTGVLSLR
jgi:hypothetical protein